MSRIEQTTTDNAERRAQIWRAIIYLGIAAQVLIYLYLYVTIARHANPRGDGMEWVAVMPASVVLVVGALPAWVLRERRRLLPLAAVLAVAGIVLNIAFFLEIAREFAGSAP